MVRKWRQVPQFPGKVTGGAAGFHSLSLPFQWTKSSFEFRTQHPVSWYIWSSPVDFFLISQSLLIINNVCQNQIFQCAAAKLPKVFHGDQRHQKDTFIYINQVFGAVCLSASSSKLDDDHLRTKLLPHEETGINPVNIGQLSWKPRAFLLKGFLSDDECDHLIKLAKDHLEKSMVADNESGKSVMSTVRTSSGYFLQSGHDEIVTRIENRIAAVTFLPKENAETIHILHYKIGEKYEPHFDYFHDETNKAMGGHRYATVLMYLSNVKKGGETVFPNAEDWARQVKDDSYSDCAKKGFAVKPKKGDALLFYSLHVNTTTDPLSMYGSCAVIEGEKWSATRWIHDRPFAPTPAEDITGSCVDTTKSCSGWAAIGECQKNPKYMLSYCKKSCNSC